MVYIFNKVDQKRRHVHDPADPRILFCQCIGVIVAPAALLHILRQRDEQSGGITLLHQIPQIQQAGHSSVAVKPGMQVSDIEVDDCRFQKIVHGGFQIDKVYQIAHILRQHLPGKASVFYLVAHDIDAVVTILMAGQEPVRLR